MNRLLLSSIVRLAGFLCMLAIIHQVQLHQAFAQTPKARAFLINERIRIDGKLDEPAWQSATPIGELVQVLPKQGVSPSEKTDIRVCVPCGWSNVLGLMCPLRSLRNARLALSR